MKYVSQILLLMLVFQYYLLPAQFPLDTLFESKEMPQGLLRSNIRFSQAVDGRYSISFFKNDTLIADLQFNQDSSLSFCYLVFQDKLLLEASTKSTKEYFIAECNFDGFSDSTFVSYRYVNDLEDFDTSSQFYASNGRRAMMNSYDKGISSFCFLENSSTNEFTIYDVDNDGSLISKTFMKRVKNTSRKMWSKYHILGDKPEFLPFKKYYYKNGYRIRKERYVDGVPVKKSD